MAIERHVASPDPEDGEAKCLGADRVPAVGGDKTDTHRQQLQVIDGELINARRRLVDAGRIDRYHGVEV